MAANGDIYAGGEFTRAGGISASRIAKWNGTAWSALGTGVTNGTSSYVYVDALAVASNGDVYAGGNFTEAGGVAVNHVAKWNGTTWSALGTGLSDGASGNGYVLALAVAGNGDVYAGGEFTLAGGVAVNYVARWNGTAWSALGTGLTGGTNGRSVSSLAVAGNGDVYAGGGFTQAGGVAANKVARWNGTAWSSLGTGAANGMNDHVLTLAVAGNGDVYAGGSFTLAGGTAANSLAKWNGTTWSPLGTGTANGTNDYVSDLAVASNGDVYAGGSFTQVGGVAASRVARWNGTAWSPLGTGLNDDIGSLAVGSTGKLYAGGGFSATGDDSKVMVNFGIYDPTAPLATTSARATPAALFPNPAHGTATLRLPAGAPRQSLILTDTQGRLVRRYPVPATADAELDLRGLPAGVYVVRCGALTQRLVVE